jgi:hypothetical protein
MQVRAAFRVWYLLLTGDRRAAKRALPRKPGRQKGVHIRYLTVRVSNVESSSEESSAATTASTCAIRTRSMSPFRLANEAIPFERPPEALIENSRRLRP